MKYPKVELPSNILSNISYVCIGRETEVPTATEICFPYDDIYPLQTIQAFPQKFQLLAPNKIENVLKQEYGDNYMIPISKGYKYIVCYTDPLNVSLLLSSLYLLYVLYFIKCKIRFKKLKA